MVNNKIIKAMTLKEKASLTSGKDFWQTQDLPKYGIESMFLADGPHGVRKQAKSADHLGLNESLKATCFPTAVTLASTWNLELVEEVGRAIGLEALDQKVNVILGPGTNIKRNPLCGRNFEYFSEDPYLSGKVASAEIKGIQSNGIASSVKHYAANNQEERRLVSNSVVDIRTLRELYLTPFEMAVKEGKTKTLMSAYNLVNSVYANENEFLLRDVLRNEWGFNGVVVTDWGGNNDRIKGLIAGNELEMPGNGGDTNREIIKAIENNELDVKYLDEAVDRLITLSNETNRAIKDYQGNLNYLDHHEIATKAAREGIVLLKNKDNILPITNEQKIAIIGDFARNPRYQGAGSSIINPINLEIPIEMVDEYNFNVVGFAKGFKRYGRNSKSLIRKAIKLSKKADTIFLYLGLDEITEVEGMERESMRLPNNQIKLLNELSKLGKKIVLILSAGAALEMPFTDQVDAIIHGQLLGQANARSVFDVISGKINPSGRLSETYPISYDDVPSKNYFPGKELTAEYREGLFVGYRYYDTNDVLVKYPFGFGLSYTNFNYDNLIINETGIKVDITNAGNYDGSEVVQLYIGKKSSDIIRPKKELKGFEKVFIKKGETKTVEILFDEYSFRFFDVLSNKYQIEEGLYQIYVGKNIEEICLEAEIYQEGIKLNKADNLPSYYSGEVTNVSKAEFEALLGHQAPNSKRTYIKKNRIIVDYNTTVAELRYARGWTGRLFSRAIRVTPIILKMIGKKQLSNTIYMGMYHQPMRGLSRMTNGIITFAQLEGLLTMFNGKFFKGFKEYRKATKIKKQRLKQERKEQMQ